MDSRRGFSSLFHLPANRSFRASRLAGDPVSDTSDPAENGGPTLPPGVSLISVEDELKRSYLDYAMSVIIGRALPDVRDGLKPVQRRVLYAMHSEGLVSTKKTSKCAGVVGEVLKKFHPHGDSSVYDALVHLVQPWAKRMPLIDGQGNFGSIDGDSPAAYRYTECRMFALSEAVLADIEKQTVDFSPNFDESTEEPNVLPSMVPTLLINGAGAGRIKSSVSPRLFCCTTIHRHLPPRRRWRILCSTST